MADTLNDRVQANNLLRKMRIHNKIILNDPYLLERTGNVDEKLRRARVPGTKRKSPR